MWGGGGGIEVQGRGGCWSECDGSLGIEVVLVNWQIWKEGTDSTDSTEPPIFSS